MRAIRRFTVRTVLPAELAALGELVLNLRWSWHPETLDLFAEVDPALWEQVGHDPVALLGAVERRAGWPSWPPTGASCAASPTPPTICGST